MPRPPVIQFGPFTAHLDSGELRRDGRKLRLQAQPFDILVMLLERPGQVVSREEIRNRLWAADTFVDFDHSLSTAINKIRAALNDSVETPRFVETLTKRGYRFIGQIRPALAPPYVEEPNPAQVSDNLSAKPRVLLITMAILIAIVGSVAYHWHQRSMPASAALRIRTIAVLPLENLSGNAGEEFFADGMTDELITMLAKNSSLRVVSRTSAMQYRGAHRPLRDIARELGVDGVVEGSVARSGDNFRVTAQLIYAPTDTHLWSESYERNIKDVFLLERELAQTIAERVNIRFNSATLPLKQINPDAHEAYLRGRFAWFASRDDQARAFFQKAVDVQPDYGAAWSGLADSFVIEAVHGSADPKLTRMKAEPMAHKALELDESSPEAHNTMAAIHLFLDWDWRAAEEDEQRAIELDPNYAEAHHVRSYVLQAMNRLDESVEEAKMAIAVDPASRPWGLGYALFLTHKFDAAVVELQQRSAARPTDVGLHHVLRCAYQFKGMLKESVAEFLKELELQADHESVLEVSAAFEKEGYQGVAKWQLHRLQREAKTGYVSSDRFAEAYADLRDQELTLRYLQLAYQERSPQMIRVHLNPRFDFLHSDPRFQSLVKKVGLSTAF